MASTCPTQRPSFLQLIMREYSVVRFGLVECQVAGKFYAPSETSNGK